MGIEVKTVASGGRPVVDVTATNPGLGMPVTESLSGRGIPVTKVSLAVGGLPVTFVAASNYWPPFVDTSWVPANAKIHVDFLGGSPQGRAWSNGAEVNINTVIDIDELGLENLVPGEGLRGYPSVAFVGPALALLLDSFTCRLQTFWPLGATQPNLDALFTIKEMSDSYALQLDLKFPTSQVWFQGYNEIDLRLLSAPLQLGDEAYNAVAFTLTTISNGGRLEFAVNGSAVTSGVYDTDDRPVTPPFTDPFVFAGNLALQSITLYDPLPTTAGLSALSAVS